MALVTYLRNRTRPEDGGDCPGGVSAGAGATEPGPFEDGVDVRPGRWDGGPDGVLAIHGYTGSPHSMRPWADHLAAAGYAVEMPLLPGHGTTVADMSGTGWRDWVDAVDAAYWRLRGRCRNVGVVGLSMGGALALHLAARYPVSAVSVVNPGVVDPQPLMAAARYLARVLPEIHGVRNDIAKEGVVEGAYPRVPVSTAADLHRLFALTRQFLPAVRPPVQVFRSNTDHVVTEPSLAALERRLPRPPEVLRLPNSFHVATLDHDAPTIFRESLRFLGEHGLEPRFASATTAPADSRPTRKG